MLMIFLMHLRVGMPEVLTYMVTVVIQEVVEVTLMAMIVI